jgi:hypothetical protein
MLTSLLRLLAIRPLLGAALFGIPVLLLIVVGLLSIWLLKLLVFVVLPVMAIIWLVRRLFRTREPGVVQ